jgi:hypothetical protein
MGIPLRQNPRVEAETLRILSKAREKVQEEVITHVHSSQFEIKNVSMAPVALTRVVILLSETEKLRRRVAKISPTFDIVARQR